MPIHGYTLSACVFFAWPIPVDVAADGACFSACKSQCSVRHANSTASVAYDKVLSFPQPSPVVTTTIATIGRDQELQHPNAYKQLLDIPLVKANGHQEQPSFPLLSVSDRTQFTCYCSNATWVSVCFSAVSRLNLRIPFFRSDVVTRLSFGRSHLPSSVG